MMTFAKVKQFLLASAVTVAVLAVPNVTTAQESGDVTAAEESDVTTGQESDGSERGSRFAERMIERFDTDGDGAVTLEEYLAAEDRFAGADADGDGFLTEEEIAARAADPRGRMVDRWVGRLDTDDDGRISLDEAKAAAAERAERRFARADTDGDGFIDEAEARAALDNVRDRRMARRGDRDHRERYRHGRHHHHDGWREGRYDDDRDRRRGRREMLRYDDDDGRDIRGDRRAEARDRREDRRAERHERREDRRAEWRERRAEWLAAEMLRIMDTDGDDRISKAEADARIATRFAQLDKDDDGRVVAAELQEGMQRFGRGERRRYYHHHRF